MNIAQRWELEEAIANALGMQSQYEDDPDECVEKIEEMLQEEPIETALNIVQGLLPMAFIGKSAILGKVMQGFGKIDDNGNITAIVQREISHK